MCASMFPHFPLCTEFPFYLLSVCVPLLYLCTALWHYDTPLKGPDSVSSCLSEVCVNV